MSEEEQAVTSQVVAVGVLERAGADSWLRKAEEEGEPKTEEKQEVKVGSDDVEEAAEEHERDEQDGEVRRRSWGLTAPATVSKQARQEHERTHMPFRPWCPIA